MISSHTLVLPDAVPPATPSRNGAIVAQRAINGRDEDNGRDRSDSASVMAARTWEAWPRRRLRCRWAL